MLLFVGTSVTSNSVWLYGLHTASLLCPWDSVGGSTGVGCRALLQGLFPAQGLNPGLRHCRRTPHGWAAREAPWAWCVLVTPVLRWSLLCHPCGDGVARFPLLGRRVISHCASLNSSPRPACPEVHRKAQAKGLCIVGGRQDRVPLKKILLRNHSRVPLINGTFKFKVCDTAQHFIAATVYCIWLNSLSILIWWVGLHVGEQKQERLSA